MKNERTFRSGAALLITLMLVSVIAASAFGVGKLILQSVGLNASLEDSTIAYQAARAGIEEGLLRYRADSNFETDVTGSGGTQNSKQSYRFALPHYGDGTPIPSESPVPDFTNPKPNATTQAVYDLRAWFHADPFGIGCSGNDGKDSQFPDQMYNGDDGTVPTLGYNKTLKMSTKNLLDIQGQSIQLILCWSNILSDAHHGKNDDEDTQEYYPIMQFTMRDSGGNVIPNPPTPECKNGRKAAFNINSQGIAEIDITLNIAFQRCNNPINNPPQNSRVVLSGTAKSGTITYPIDTGKEIIESTGYFGSAKRRLRAEIDRSTTPATLLGIYDYSIFNGSDPVTPTP